MMKANRFGEVLVVADVKPEVAVALSPDEALPAPHVLVDFAFLELLRHYNDIIVNNLQ